MAGWICRSGSGFFDQPFVGKCFQVPLKKEQVVDLI